MAARGTNVFIVAVLVAGLQPGLAQHVMQFEPLLDDIMALDSSMMHSINPRGGAAAPGAAGPRRPSMHSKEDQIDRDMEAIFGALLSSLDEPAPQKLRAGKPPPGAKTHIESLPLEAFEGLFPGPLVYGHGPSEMDPIIMEMLGETHAGFQDTMVPMVHSAAEQASINAPNVCHADVLKHCGRSHSQLHCLGAHQKDIDKKCRDTVGKSVPFVCSDEIDRFCDTLHRGILPCLERHLHALEIDCRDSVKASRHVITTANTHRVKLKSAKSGVTASVTPSPQVLAEALKELNRKATQLASSASVSEAVQYVPFFVIFCALVYVLYTDTTIYVPEMVRSWKLVRQLQVARHGKLAVFGCWGGGSGEGKGLLADTEMQKTVDGCML